MIFSCNMRLLAAAVSWLALLLSPAQGLASPLESGGFKFVAVAAGDSSVTLPIPIATPSSGLRGRGITASLPAGSVEASDRATAGRSVLA